jgi:hypothetical protein
VHVPSKRSYVFVDDSNVFIEGQRAAASLKGSDAAGDTYRLDFGALLEFVRPKDGEVYFSDGDETFPKVYGSEPPKLDSLWEQLRERHVDVKVFQKNFFGKEKRVDTEIVLDIGKLIYEMHPRPTGEELVVVGGDQDYQSSVERAEARGWRTRVVFWRTANSVLKRRDDFVDLTPHLDRVGRFERFKFEHKFPDWKTDWSKVVPYHEGETPAWKKAARGGFPSSPPAKDRRQS